MLRIYTEFTAPDNLQDAAIPHPVLKHHFDGVSEAGRAAGLANPKSPFVLVAEPAEADIFVLAYEWSYYAFFQRQEEAKALAAKAGDLGKQVWVWHRGDLSPLIPFDNYVSCQSALYRSRLDRRQVAAPFFIDDPLPTSGAGELQVRGKRDRPTVGFCGYAGVVWAKVVYGIYHNLLHNYRSRRGESPWDVVPIKPATLIRSSALELLERSPAIDTLYRIRRRAFKRLSQMPSDEETRIKIREYFDTVINTDYTLCVRGNGNWSVRLWETLACGRIPIFVDTDCVLPEAGIDWKELCVWVDQRELGSLPERLLAFHAKLSPAEFIERQRLCRQLWVERFSREGFMKHMAEVGIPQWLNSRLTGGENPTEIPPPLASPRER